MSCGCAAESAPKKIFEKFITQQLNIIKKKAKEGQDYGVLIGNTETDGKKIKGTLAYAGVSRNNRLYLPEELSKGDGMTVPLIINHASIEGAEDELYVEKRLPPEIVTALENNQEIKVGRVTLSWDPEHLLLSYEGIITDPFFIKEVADAGMNVSLGMYYDADSPKVCDQECYTMIKGAEFHEVSLVYHPGFPIATLEAAESLLKNKAIELINLHNPITINQDLKMGLGEYSYKEVREALIKGDIKNMINEAIGPHSRGYGDQINEPTSTPEITGSNSTGKFEDPQTRLARARMNQNIMFSTDVEDIEWTDDPPTNVNVEHDYEEDEMEKGVKIYRELHNIGAKENKNLKTLLWEE